MNNILLAVQTQPVQPVTYWIGGILAFIILAYLAYSLVHPEKF
jgi:K+-transporting ATPase KdpF subunit